MATLPPNRWPTCPDDDHAILLDVLDSDPLDERRVDGTHNGWLIGEETVNFPAWNHATDDLVP